MKITKVEATPILLPFKKPYYWAQGVFNSSGVVLVSVHTDIGLVGYGESMMSADPAASVAILEAAGKRCVGRPVHSVNEIMKTLYHEMFQVIGTFSAPRFGAMVLTGLDLALWDLVGKKADLPLHKLLGGAVRNEIRYFGFAQGERPTEIAVDAARLAGEGFDPIYVKIGRGDELDIEIVREVREAIGNRRLRVDANEAWDQLRALRMSQRLRPFNVEFIEQPTTSRSIAALAHLKREGLTGIAVDQAVFTPEDVFDVCSQRAADVIVLGLHETGGVTPFIKAAAIAEAAGLNICIHGVYESGITTCASNMIAATISNLDDGNQFMNSLISDDIIESPNLILSKGTLGVLDGPGLGFNVDWNAVERLRL